MSKPETTAPSRRAVAIACSPATPAPEHEDLGRRDGACGGGHHREEAAGLARGKQRRGVAGDVGLGGQRVHRLGAGDARDRLHREAGHARGGERLVRLGRGQRRQVADQDLARVQTADLLGGRHRDVDDDVRAPGIADLRAGLGVRSIGMPRALAGAGLDDHVDALIGKRFDHVRDQRHAALCPSSLFRNPDLHPWRWSTLRERAFGCVGGRADQERSGRRVAPPREPARTRRCEARRRSPKRDRVGSPTSQSSRSLTDGNGSMFSPWMRRRQDRVPEARRSSRLRSRPSAPAGRFSSFAMPDDEQQLLIVAEGVELAVDRAQRLGGPQPRLGPRGLEPARAARARRAGVHAGRRRPLAKRLVRQRERVSGRRRLRDGDIMRFGRSGILYRAPAESGDRDRALGQRAHRRRRLARAAARAGGAVSALQGRRLVRDPRDQRPDRGGALYQRRRGQDPPAGAVREVRSRGPAAEPKARRPWSSARSAAA